MSVYLYTCFIYSVYKEHVFYTVLQWIWNFVWLYRISPYYVINEIIFRRIHNVYFDFFIYFLYSEIPKTFKNIVKYISSLQNDSAWYWPLSCGCTVHLKEKIISERSLSFTEVRYNCNFKIITLKVVIKLC